MAADIILELLCNRLKGFKLMLKEGVEQVPCVSSAGTQHTKQRDESTLIQYI